MQEVATVLSGDQIERAIVRLSHEIVEQNSDENLALVGVHRRGAILARRMHPIVSQLRGGDVHLGDLDISLYRDDVASRPAAPVLHSTHLEFPVAGTTVVIVDDVLFTGRTARAAIDAIFDYGRPARIRLAVLCDRGHRELPIRPDHVGKNIPSSLNDRVNVSLAELDGLDQVSISSVSEGRVESDG